MESLYDVGWQDGELHDGEHDGRRGEAYSMGCLHDTEHTGWTSSTMRALQMNNSQDG